MKWTWTWTWLFEVFLDALLPKYQWPEKPVSDIMPPMNPKPAPKPAPESEFATENAEKLYTVAFSLLGKDLDPTDKVPDVVACADQCNLVFKAAFGREIGGRASTADMYRVLKHDPRFKQVDAYEPGAIIISPTGTSTKNYPNGHVGICGKTNIMSNHSATGLWDQAINLAGWMKYYHVDRGFPVYFFRVL